jgi:hypothetical protein
LAWVLFGISIANVSTAIILFGTADNGEVARPWYAKAAEVASLLFPVTLAYAILKHRILDLRFVINRTIVYGVIVAVVATVISLGDWLVSRMIAESRTAIIIDALIAVALGFLLRWMHEQVERLVDRVVFRSRYLGSERLGRHIGALDYAESASTVDDTVALAAARALNLASAAVFRRDNEGREYTCRSAFGWTELAGIVGTESFIVRALQTENALLDLNDEALEIPGAPSADARSYMALPISTRHDLKAFVLYGRHADGTIPDPTERALLERLAHTAAASYESIAMQSYREQALRAQAGPGTHKP